MRLDNEGGSQSTRAVAIYICNPSDCGIRRGESPHGKFQFHSPQHLGLRAGGSAIVHALRSGKGLSHEELGQEKKIDRWQSVSLDQAQIPRRGSMSTGSFNWDPKIRQLISTKQITLFLPSSPGSSH